MIAVKTLSLPAPSATPLQTGGYFGTSHGDGMPMDQHSGSKAYDAFKLMIHNRLIDRLNFAEVQKLPEEKRRSEIRSALQRLLIEEESTQPGQFDRERLIQELLNDTLGLGPLEGLLNDPSVSDILVNGSHEVYVERKGMLYLSDVRFKDDEHLMQIIERIVSRVGRQVNESSPMVDARLKDGSRVNVILPPLSLRGPTMCIRRFGAVPLHMNDMVLRQEFPEEMAMLMESAVKARLNIIISGGTGSGKTTLLNALSSFISHSERIISIEDAAELQLQQPHVVQLEGRPPNIEGRGQVTIRDLMRNALRMRPDRIIIGECRGAEALDMLQAMNTGHDGSLTTMHANAPRDAMARLETMIMMSGFELPIKAMRQQISSALNMLIQVNRLQGGGRRVTSITEIVGMEGDVIVTQDIYQFQQSGINSNGEAEGSFECKGVRPHFMSRLNAAGIELPPAMFEERTLLKV